MIIPKEEVEKAAKNFGNSGVWQCPISFKAGIEFSKEYVQKHVQDIITENQGLKLYKDNEAERFKELAVELIDWLSLDPQFTKFATNKLNEEELYELFKKENYIK